MTHAIKIEPQFYKDVESLNKTFEVRKADREYKVGDALLLQEYDAETKKYSGKEWSGYINYVFTDEAYVKKGFVILGIKPKEY